MTQKWNVRLLGTLAVVAIAFGAGRFAVGFLRGDPPGPRIDSSMPARIDGRTESVRFVVMTSASCGACGDPELPEMLRQALTSVRQQALDGGLSVWTLGIDVDHLPSAALASLGRFGDFDEVVLGGGWQNLGALEFIWQGHPGQAAVPQVIVLRQVVEAVPTRILGSTTTVVTRVVGLEALRRWRRQGFAINLGGAMRADSAFSTAGR